MLLLVLLGCADFGRFLYHHIAITNAARAGAAYAIMNPCRTASPATWQAATAAVARAEIARQTASFDPTKLTVDVPLQSTANGLIDAASGNRRVRVTTGYTFRTLVTWPGIPAILVMRSTIELPQIR